MADALKTLHDLPGGGRLFRYEHGGSYCNLTGARLNEYIRQYMGEEFTAKDFRTWGRTLVAAIALAEKGVPETETEGKRKVAAVSRLVGDKLGNTPAVARVVHQPAVIEQYLDGRTIDDFRPRHLRVVGARDTGLDREERAAPRLAAFVANSALASCGLNSVAISARLARFPFPLGGPHG